MPRPPALHLHEEAAGKTQHSLVLEGPDNYGAVPTVQYPLCLGSTEEH
uniref:Uncharacterized protein n=1 Tax=Otolemur garnettii TaxID=30611 RepID=H0XHB5_OTOGA